ncbi:MAG: SDR family NAD(P)-dependent oxidoreductase, partial [Nannocystaceae bacterium]
SQQDWDLIYQVHVLGSFKVSHAAWPHMREQRYGRIIMTSSAAGLYGNFGQANYSTAKLGLAGFGMTLAHEGRKRGIHVHTIAPVAGSRMTETILPPNLIEALKPEYVSPLVAYLCHESCEETGGIFEVGGGMVAKLRWQRTEGKMFRIGRDITPERIRDDWKTVVDFGQATYPTDAMSAIKPVLDNIALGPSRGGNQYIDCDEAYGFEFPPSTTRYDQRDLALYALGVGAARDPLNTRDLQLVYEMHGSGFRSLPTYGVVPALNAIIERASKGGLAPGLNFGVERLLHGEQRLEVTRPLPPSCTLTHHTTVRDIWDKGKHAVVVLECVSRDKHGDAIVRNEVSLLIKGAGGWGGERGPSEERNTPPSRDPDATTTESLSPNQALLYRLSGDINPLHADPNFARAFGFDKPILHGLCTFGHAGRHIINAFCDGDPRLFKSIDVRFSNSVFPGETLITEMWKESETRIVFRCRVQERDKVVISHAAVELYREIPTAPDRSKPAAEATPEAAVQTGPISADVFTAIGQHITQNPGIVQKIGKVFCFQLTDPAGAWTVDLKQGSGSVCEGTNPADCTLEMTDADFMAMCAGKLNAQKLYFDGRLKITGDVMASQKLTFLAKLDPKQVQAAAKARAGAGGANAGSAASPAPAKGPGAAEVFVGIGDHITRHPELVEKIGKVFLWQLTGPDSQWTLDLKTAPGGIAPGETTKPNCTLTLSEANFLAMSRGELNPQALYFDGKLKIAGDVMASQKLTFLKDIDPELAKAAVA